MGKDASTIKQEIAQTRERMSDTVEALGYKADVPSRVKENVQDRVEAVKGTLGDVVDNVKTAVSGAGDSVKTAVGGATDTMDQTGATGAGKFAETRAKVTQAVSQVNDGISSRLNNVDVGANAQRAVGVVKENPLGLALAALAIGFLTGSLVPVSEMERSRLRPIRDKIVDQAQAATTDLVEAGKAVVAETAQSVVSTALGSAQTHGHEVVDAAKARATES